MTQTDLRAASRADLRVASGTDLRVGPRAAISRGPPHPPPHPPPSVDTQLPRLPRAITLSVLGLSIAPSILSALGVDFASARPPPDLHAQGPALVDSMFHTLGGAFTHTLLEWTAFSIAMCTVVLAFAHFATKRDVVTPVIALALFASGCMDAFHTLAAARLVDAVAPNQDLIPFTWALSRLFNSLICMIGVATLLLTSKSTWSGRHGAMVVAGAAALFGLAAFGIIEACATSSELPLTQYPDARITRPWDVGPFFVFLASSFLFVKFYQRRPSLFTYALVLSTVPDLATQGHMALGSSALFDSHFNIAHFLKLVAYAVPFVGLVMEYIRTHRQAATMIGDLEHTRAGLQEVNLHLMDSKQELERSNADLQQFAYIASHDLKAPLRGIRKLVEWVGEDLEDGDPGAVAEHLKVMTARVHRMEGLIEGILKYSRLDYTNVDFAQLDVGRLLERVGEAVLPPDGSFVLDVGDMPVLETSDVLLSQVFSNLVGNAVSHHDKGTGVISVRCRRSGNGYRFEVRDDGPGIEPAYHDKVFQIFQTLERRDVKDSTGIGLSLVKKLVLGQGGEVGVRSDGIRGSTFYFTWPAVHTKGVAA